MALVGGKIQIRTIYHLRKDHKICIRMQRSIRRFSFLNDLWDSIDIIEVEERKMKKLVLTMLSIAGMMLFTALPAKALHLIM